MTISSEPKLADILKARFGGAADLQDSIDIPDLISSMISRGSCRAFLDTPVPQELLTLISATALSSPTKSDLQQRDIIFLRSPEQRKRLCDLVSGQTWVSGAPMIAVFCGNNRRQRLLHDWQDVPFANDHLDAFFNAVGDAAIALGAFVTAAEALGIGCCPISAIRNEAKAVSELLCLPDHVFPFAGLAIGYPKGTSQMSRRLPLDVTCHVDCYQEDHLEEAVGDYDKARAAAQPYDTQRFAAEFGEKENYAWSDDKVRQYSQPERAGFGDYVRSQGFKLE